jgi:hypothetical protein
MLALQVGHEEVEMSWTVEIPEPGSLTESRGQTSQALGGLAELSESYRQMGFEAGYAQAARDQLESSVVIAEQILRERSNSFSGPLDARRLLYAFIARVDRRLSLYANPASLERDGAAGEKCATEFMEGGLGI